MAYLILRHFAGQGTTLLMVPESPPSLLAAEFAGAAVRRWHLMAHPIVR